MALYVEARARRSTPAQVPRLVPAPALARLVFAARNPASRDLLGIVINTSNITGWQVRLRPRSHENDVVKRASYKKQHNGGTSLPLKDRAFIYLRIINAQTICARVCAAVFARAQYAISARKNARAMLP
ncbi:hypothetical protein ACJJTC_013785 [Scirpophaga incertulas]